MSVSKKEKKRVFDRILHCVYGFAIATALPITCTVEHALLKAHRRLLNVCMLLHWFSCSYMSKHLNYLLKLIFCIDFIMFLFIYFFFFSCVCLLKWTLTFLLLFILCGVFFYRAQSLSFCWKIDKCLRHKTRLWSSIHTWYSERAKHFSTGYVVVHFFCIHRAYLLME